MIDTETPDISEGLKTQAVVTPTAEVHLDWVGYFHEFCARHGGGPVHTGDGRLLFQDGWMYSGSEHKGPEYPPPDDAEELRQLIVRYYKTRKFMVEVERDELQRRLAHIKGLQAGKSLPLMERFQYWDAEGGAEGTGGFVADSRPVDLAGMEGRLSWLSEDVGHCEARLEGLSDE